VLLEVTTSQRPLPQDRSILLAMLRNCDENRRGRGFYMANEPIERLTARHRDCLRLVASNHSTKEIALALHLSPNTVDGYIGEAKEIIGAPTRRDAARAFQAFCDARDPEVLGGEFSRVALANIAHSKRSGEPEIQTRDASSFDFGQLRESFAAPSRTGSFHWFRGERKHNSLSSRQRLIWIATASVVAAFIFVAALTSIDTLARLLSHRAP
jgi:DNA-binding CsgD family transcriptional regulator